MTETKYYSLLDLLLDIGAFKSVLEIAAYVLVSAYAYKSYSTYVSRQIQKDIKQKSRESDFENP